MLKYAHIEAIHEAMRECENERLQYQDRDMHPTIAYEARDVEACFARIRDALAGTARADGSDERMVRPEDVDPAVTERSTEDSKITWQG